jgi:DNA-binding NarL/FixJ family response regulator
MYPEEQYALRAMKAGAQGYLTKRSASDELVLAVRKILSGNRYISPEFAEKMLYDFESNAEKLPHERLSDRELQVLCMIGGGKAVNRIAGELHVSANTVRTYRTRILEKIGVRNQRIDSLCHHPPPGRIKRAFQ